MVLSYINMNPPQVYTCSPSLAPLPPPSPYHPSGSSQCTSPKHPVSCIEPALVIRFTYDIIHVSMPSRPFILALEGPLNMFIPGLCILIFRSPAFKTNHFLHILYLLPELSEISALFTLAFPMKLLSSFPSIKIFPVYRPTFVSPTELTHLFSSLCGAGADSITDKVSFKGLRTQRWVRIFPSGGAHTLVLGTDMHSNSCITVWKILQPVLSRNIMWTTKVI